MADRTLHLHFGAGPLGVGLVLEQCNAELVQFVLCNRFAASRSALTAHIAKTHQARLRVGDGPVQVRSIDEFVPTDEPAGIERIAELLLSEGPLVITISVNQGQRDIADLLALPLKQREELELPPASIVVCENRPDPVWQNLRESLKATRVLTRVVVDRICVVEGDAFAPVVHAEPYFEWRVARD